MFKVYGLTSHVLSLKLLCCSIYLVIFQFLVVGGAVVEEFALAGGLAVADGDAVVATVKADKHAAVARNKGGLEVNGLIVNIVAGIVGVVEVEGAAVVVALSAVAGGVVADHPDLTIRIFDVVGAVLVDVVVEPRIRDVDLVVFAVPQLEDETSRVGVLLLGLPFHPFGRRNQRHLLQVVIDFLT